MTQTPEHIWNNCLDYIKENISLQSYKTWFSPIKPVKVTGDVLHIQVPSKFFAEWLEEHYITLLKASIRRELGEQAKLVYSILVEKPKVNLVPQNGNLPKKEVVKSVPNVVKTQTQIPVANQTTQVAKKAQNSADLANPFVTPMLNRVQVESQLNRNYSFDNFIEGDSNRLARSAGYAVAQKPGGTSFNPLLIYGGVGLGKTHLAHAIGIEIEQNFQDKTVLFVSAEKFTQQFIDAIRKNTRNDFVHFYQMIDVLIIDDVQFFSGKEKTQDVFFHIFNHLHQQGKQLILTSDRAPVDMQGMEQRLLSRFKWGLSADLQKPALETRIAILNKKLVNDGIKMPDEIIEYLAYSISSNVRELEGALISLVAHSTLNKKDVTLSLAKSIVDRYVKDNVNEITIEIIQKIVCKYFDIPMDVLVSKTRKRNIVQARQIVMYLAKKHTKKSLVKIGKENGGRDHATVLHACKTVKNLIDIDKDFSKYVLEIDRKLSFD
ncbi:MAG: chromosomal replication initiator protein DnaA [Flavobacteriales bacterium]